MRQAAISTRSMAVWTIHRMNAPIIKVFHIRMMIGMAVHPVGRARRRRSHEDGLLPSDLADVFESESR